MHRRRRYRVRRGEHRAAAERMLACFACLFLMLLITHWLRPRLADYAENAIQYQVTLLMEQAVSQAASAQSQELSSLMTLSDGRTAALTTDSVLLEHIRSQVVDQAYTQINKLESEQSSVPIGTLIDPLYFAGKGPGIPYSIVGLGRISASTSSDFSESGINQTRYTLSMTVRAEVQLHALWCSRQIVIENTYPMAETIIVGEVPVVNAAKE